MVFFFQARLSDAPFVERQMESYYIGSFLSSAASQWEMAVPDCAGSATFRDCLINPYSPHLYRRYRCGEKIFFQTALFIHSLAKGVDVWTITRYL